MKKKSASKANIIACTHQNRDTGHGAARCTGMKSAREGVVHIFTHDFTVT
jgi:hypothetical protein